MLHMLHALLALLAVAAFCAPRAHALPGRCALNPPTTGSLTPTTAAAYSPVTTVAAPSTVAAHSTVYASEPDPGDYSTLAVYIESSTVNVYTSFPAVPPPTYASTATTSTSCSSTSTHSAGGASTYSAEESTYSAEGVTPSSWTPAETPSLPVEPSSIEETSSVKQTSSSEDLTSSTMTATAESTISVETSSSEPAKTESATQSIPASTTTTTTASVSPTFTYPASVDSAYYNQASPAVLYVTRPAGTNWAGFLPDENICDCYGGYSPLSVEYLIANPTYWSTLQTALLNDHAGTTFVRLQGGAEMCSMWQLQTINAIAVECTERHFVLCIQDGN